VTASISASALTCRVAREAGAAVFAFEAARVVEGVAAKNTRDEVMNDRSLSRHRVHAGDELVLRDGPRQEEAAELVDRARRRGGKVWRARSDGDVDAREPADARERWRLVPGIADRAAGVAKRTMVRIWSSVSDQSSK
jgi:hypothetical protein